MNGEKMVAHAICGSINNYQLLLMFGYSDEYGYSQEKADELFAQAEKTFLEKKGLIGDNNMSQVFSIFFIIRILWACRIFGLRRINAEMWMWYNSEQLLCMELF